MTSKEKALELFDKYFEATNNYYQAKQCALIAVDEILYNCYEVMKPFWEEVKKEIELL
jgi:hypothetical protein